MKRVICLALAILFTTACSSSNASFRYKNNHLKSDENTASDELVIRVPALGSMGDCTLVSLGNADLLIDCGGENKAAEDRIYTLLKENVKDKVIEYVIITHPDGDHVKGFISKDSGVTKWLLEGGKIDTLIDYDSSQDSTVTDTLFKGIRSEKATYEELGQHSDYCVKRDALIKSCKIDSYYTASQCLHKKRKLSEEQIAVVQKDICSNNLPTSKAYQNSKSLVLSDTFYLEDGDNSAELKILNNVMTYTNDLSLATYKSPIVNCMSVCSLITYRGDKFLFTGDLEEFETQNKTRLSGETRLVNNNVDELKDGVLFFRGGHHGSSSSSSAYFTSVIRPQYVSWTSIAGVSPDKGRSPVVNRFPTQYAINNIGRYTDRIYYSSCSGRYFGEDDSKVMDLYGDTTFTYSPSKGVGERMNVEYANKKVPNSFFISPYMNTYKKGLAERRVPVYVYNLTPDNALSTCPYECSYVKIGHIDILIGCGSMVDGPAAHKKQIIQKIKNLCNDKILDYLIVPSNKRQSYSVLRDDKETKGLLSSEDIIVKQMFIPNSDNEQVNNLLSHALTPNVISKPVIENVKLDENLDSTDSKVSITMAPIESSGGQGKDISLCTIVSAFGFNYLHLGSNVTYSTEPIESSLKTINKSIEKNIDAIQIPFFGRLESDSSKDFYSFMKYISTNKSNHSYYGYASDNNTRASLDGIVALFNTPFDLASGCPSKNIFQRREGDQTSSDSMLKYGEGKHLLSFSTLFTKNNSATCVPFNGNRSGDLCLRAACIDNENALEVRTAVAANYSISNLCPLVFKDFNTSKIADEESSAASALRIDEQGPRFKEINDVLGNKNYQSE